MEFIKLRVYYKERNWFYVNSLNKALEIYKIPRAYYL